MSALRSHDMAGALKAPRAPSETELAARPLLELVMIVKNEAASIEATIRSVQHVVDHYTILDTGSTDGTPALIRAAFARQGVPGAVHSGPFVDFGATRNRAIELAGFRCVFVLMLSGDETLRPVRCFRYRESEHVLLFAAIEDLSLSGFHSIESFVVCVGVVVVDRHGGVLRRFLAKRRAWRAWVGAHGRRQEAYNVRVEFGAEVYDSTRVHRTDAMWYYEGVTHARCLALGTGCERRTAFHSRSFSWHFVVFFPSFPVQEYLTNAAHMVATIRAQDNPKNKNPHQRGGNGAAAVATIHHNLKAKGHWEGKRKRWALDKRLLFDAWRADPTNARTAFYLAQTYECLNELPEAHVPPTKNIIAEIQPQPYGYLGFQLFNFTLL